MAVNVQDDGSLSWDASLTTENFQKGIEAIVNGYQQAAKKAGESVDEQNASLSSLGDPLQTALKGVDDSVAGLLANLKKVGADPALQQLITQYGDLMKQQLTFKDSLSKAIDPVQVQSLNQQLTDTQEKMKSVTDQMQLLQKASIPTPEAVPDVSKIIGANVLSQLKQSFGEIDQTTQKFIQSMIDLEIRLQKLQVAQSDLSQAYAQGKVSEEDYAKTSAFMVAETKNITDETQKLTENQKEYEASLRGTTGSINDKKQQLASLKQAYENLSEAERNSAKGQALNTKIGSLTQEISGLKTAGNSIVSVRSELLQLQEQMARNPDSPLFDTWKEKATELQIQFTKVRKEIQEGINPSAGLEAFASGLRGIVGGFEAATGVIGLATDNQEEFDRVTKNAASALALMNGIQEISNVVSKTSSLNIYLLGLMHKSNAVATALDTTATEAATVVAVENTVATGAQTVATEAATVATRGLTVALLSNPAALVVAAIAAIAGAYLLLRDNAKLAKDSSELLADANKKVNDSYAEKLSKVLPLLEAVKEGNVSEQKSIQIHEQLAAIDEKLVAGLDRKRIAYDALKINVDAYADSLRNQYRLEANSSAIQASIKTEEDISAKLKDSKELVDKFNKTLSTQLINSGTAAAITLRDKNLADVAYYTAQLKEQRATTEDLVKANVELGKSQDDSKKPKRGTDEIDKDIAAQKKLQAGLAETNQQYKDYQKTIDSLQKERDAITGKQEKATSGEKEYNKALREQLSLLQTIATLQRGAKQSGLLDEETELDKINQKYDDVIKKVQQFNKTAPKNLQIDVSTLGTARATELQNATYKKNADEYKKTLDIQKGYFEDYEKAKLEFGEDKAKKLFAAQIQGANSYLEFLKQQKSAIEKAIPDGQKPNFKQALELQNLNKQIIDEGNREQKAAVDKKLEDLKTLLKATVTFNEEKQKINKKYDDMEKEALSDTTSSPEEIANRLHIIKGLREQDLTDLQNNLLRQSDLYKKLNEDIISFTRQQLKDRVNFLNTTLKNDTTLTPETKEAVKSMVKQLGQLLHDTDPVSEKTLALADRFNAAAGGLSAISKALKGVDDNLSETVGIMSDLSSAVGTTLKSLDTLKSADATTADKVGAVTGIVSAVTTVISSVINFFKEAKDSAKRSKQELKDYNDSLITGQISYNELLRQQQLTQTSINDLTVKELQTRRDILATQKLQAQADYNALLKQIELQGQQITGEHSVKFGGFLGIGRKTKVVQDLADLSSTDYDNLLKLFTEGKLDASTAKWFQELQKVHDELDSIGTSATEVQDQINQQLTGTTASSITDSIIQGFADGKRATVDFADDFQKLMQQAVLNSLKENALAVPLQKFYKQFADAAQSDDVLTAAEIASLKDSYNATITAASQQFDELQKITKINFNSSVSTDNSLSGAIKGITEQTAQLLAGQFGGLRITAFDQLSVSRSQLTALNQIVFNTSLIATTNEILRKIDTYGLKIK